MAHRLKSISGLIRQAASDWLSDKAPRLGASLAFYTVFSLSPLLLIAVAISGLVFGEDAARNRIFHEISGLVGEQGAQAVQSVIAAAKKPAAGIFSMIVAVVTLAVGATAVFVELQDALNTLWGVKPKPGTGLWAFISNRLLSLALVVGIGFLLLVSLLLTTAVAAMSDYVSGFAPGLGVLWKCLDVIISLGVASLLFAMIFKILPDVKLAWRDVWIGAVITAILFEAGKFLIGVYLAKSSVASAYGAAGSFVIVLLWVYYSAQILFFGAEFTQVYAEKHGSHLEPVGDVEVMTAEDQLPAALKRREENPPHARSRGPAARRWTKQDVGIAAAIFVLGFLRRRSATKRKPLRKVAFRH